MKQFCVPPRNKMSCSLQLEINASAGAEMSTLCLYADLSFSDSWSGTYPTPPLFQAQNQTGATTQNSFFLFRLQFREGPRKLSICARKLTLKNHFKHTVSKNSEMQNLSVAPLFKMTEQAGHPSKQRAEEIHISKQFRLCALYSDIALFKPLTAVDSPLYLAQKQISSVMSLSFSLCCQTTAVL